MDVASEIVGYAAGFVSLFIFVPQAVKIHNGGGTRDLCFKSFIAILVAGVLWFTYGVLKGDWPLIVTNVVQIVITVYILHKMYKDFPTIPPETDCMCSKQGDPTLLCSCL